jgi:hypothetical protein
MSWGRIDDRLDDSPKFAGISLEAAGLWLLCQPQALRRGDGLIPLGVPERFAGADAERLIGVLVKRCLLDPVEAGWLYHDFEAYQKLSVIRSQAGSNGAANRWQVDGKPMAKDASRAGARREPVPEPVTRTRVNSPNGESSSRKRESDMTVSLTEFTEAWNGACDPLPRLRKPPAGSVKLGLVRQALTYFDGDLTLLAAAVGRAAADAHYRESGYGFEAFCRHVERWGNAPVASNASSRRDDKYADAPRFGPSPLAAAYIALDNAHTPEEKAAAKAAILEASK